jgi:hypothetical protein
MKAKLHSVFLLALLVGVNQAAAQDSTAFTYQGQLQDGGTNANGIYTMIFKLYDSSSGGNQISSAVTTSPTLANGLFTVNLDFGAIAFIGYARWLDITITNGGMTQTLSPRVQVLPAPYAQFATAAGKISAFQIHQILSNVVVSADTWYVGILTNDISDALVFSDNGIAQMVLGTNGQGVSFPSNVYSGGTFFGNGGGLTNLSCVPSITVFTTNGTFVVPTNVTKIIVELWGAGGGGGRGTNIPSPDGIAGVGGGGGGAGGYAWNVFSVNPGASYAVTIGVSSTGQDGTSTSFGGLLSATGGSAGANGTAVGGAGVGGAGGIGSGSLYNVTGGPGVAGIWEGYGSGGAGGSVWRGGTGGVGGGVGSDTSNGSGPGGPGGGGGGGGGVGFYPGDGTGAQGSGGVVFVYY